MGRAPSRKVLLPEVSCGPARYPIERGRMALHGNDAFAAESNRIEGITHPKDDEIHTAALRRFVVLVDEVTVADVEAFVAQIEPNARLRRAGQPNVRVGHHHAPKSGPEIERALEQLLRAVSANDASPLDAHHRYETLHPFTDGNGRSGRALWLWQMREYYEWDYRRSFLHEFYYQSLADGR